MSVENGQKGPKRAKICKENKYGMGLVCNACLNAAERACEGWPVVGWWQVLPACYDEMVLRPVRSSSTIATSTTSPPLGNC